MDETLDRPETPPHTSNRVFEIDRLVMIHNQTLRELEQIANSAAAEKVESANEEKVESADKEEVESADKEKVESADKEKVESADKEKVESVDKEKGESANKEKGEFADKEKVESADKEKVESADNERVESEDKEKVESADEEKVESADEEKVKSTYEEKVKSADKVKAKSADEENIKSSDKEKVKSAAEEKVKSADEENGKTAAEQKIKSADEEVKTANEDKGKSTDESKKEIAEKKTKDAFSDYVSYNEKGEAIYSDPNSNFKYIWDENKTSWSLLNEDGTLSLNPYENEFYRWCSETKQWVLKDPLKNNDNEKQTENNNSNIKYENEFYKWDGELYKWVLKDNVTLPVKENVSPPGPNNITYDAENDLHIYTEKDGSVFFWDVERKAWIPKIDDDFMARYQMNYGFNDDIFINCSQARDEIPEKPSTSNDAKAAGAKRKAPPEPPAWFEMPEEKNTKVYVSNLPEDITEDEFIGVMGKCGMIMKDPYSQKYKVKLYMDSNKMLKGDGLCDYIKVESVELALNILDGYDVRGKKIKVQPAKFELRGEYNPALKPKKKKKDKEKLEKLKEKLFDWRPEKMRGERSKHERVVILKNLFEPKIFEKEVALILEYQNDLREECGKCGTVRKVIIYDRHTDGVAQVSMGDPEEADLVVQMMRGRYFGQRRLTAELWDGKTKYKVEETETEEKKRLTKWELFLDAEIERTLKEPLNMGMSNLKHEELENRETDAELNPDAPEESDSSQITF